MDTQQQILTAASDLFVEGGIEALSVRAIAAKAGLSTIGIYRKFKGKQGILDALCIEGFDRLGAAISRPDADADPWTEMLKGAEEYLRVAEKYPAHYKLMFEGSTAGYEPSPAANAAAEEAFGHLIASVSRLPGLNIPAEEAAMDLWALVHGYVSLRERVGSPHFNRRWKAKIITAVERHMTAMTD